MTALVGGYVPSFSHVCVCFFFWGGGGGLYQAGHTVNHCTF